MALFITFLAGLSIALGAFLTTIAKDPEKVEHISIALAAGSMVSLMVFDLIPEALESVEGAGAGAWIRLLVFVAIGIAILKILDMFVPDHDDNEHNHDHENAAHIGVISALAIILHNIIEGMTVYSIAQSDLSQGIVLAVGISLHNIPMGMLIDSTLPKTNRTVRIVLLSVVCLSTLAGGLLTILLQSVFTEEVIAALISVALGMVIYITFLELVPHVLRTKPLKKQILPIVIGALLVFISTLFE